MSIDKIMMGGSETSLHYLEKYVDIPSNVKLHLNVVDRIDPSKVNIFWQQQSYDQPSVQHIPVDQLEKIVFVSHWQKEKYQFYHKIPAEKCVVIKNAVNLGETSKRTNRPIKLVYTSTPWRGLDVLVDSFYRMNRDDIQLHVFSSMTVYGMHYEQLDCQYYDLYEKCMEHPNIYYHGSVDQAFLRTYMADCHIFAYPNTWEETSCIAAIEAMATGLLLVTSDLGALPETTGGFAEMYSPEKDHVGQYTKFLNGCIDKYKKDAYWDKLNAQVTYTNEIYDWQKRKLEWQTFLDHYKITKNIWRL